MLSTVLRRLAAGAVTLLVLLTLSFFLLRAAPGGPLDRERALPPAIEAAMAAQFHLDEPLWQQYLRYVGGVLRGDLGPSFQYEDAQVSALIADGFAASLQLGVLALVVALGIGMPLGVIAAYRRGGWLDRSLLSLSLLGLSVPTFVVAPLLILLFAVQLDWLPAGGWERGEPADLVLPVLSLALPQIAYIAKLVRSGFVETLQMPFILTARAKGLPPSLILRRHAARPALLPLLSYLGPATAALITGSVVIEQIFAIPGIGRYFVQGALNRDYTLVLGVVLLYGTLIVLFNLIVDLLYGVLDPRTRTA